MASSGSCIDPGVCDWDPGPHFPDEGVETQRRGWVLPTVPGLVRNRAGPEPQARWTECKKKRQFWATPVHQLPSSPPLQGLLVWSRKTSFWNLCCLWSKTTGRSQWPQQWGGTFCTHSVQLLTECLSLQGHSSKYSFINSCIHSFRTSQRSSCSVPGTTPGVFIPGNHSASACKPLGTGCSPPPEAAHASLG